jgi:ribosomal protein L31|tara:strand:+ start:197 stop:967 length:771 start_codon:yes stop_codon:yes gene_type:complete
LEERKIKGISHYVYEDIDEFREHHPNIVVRPDWRDSDEDDWVYSDDGRIVQLLKVSKKVSHPNDRKNYTFAKGWVRTIVGSFLNRPNIKMDTDFSSHPNRYTFSKTIKDVSKRVRERKKITKKEREFATNVVVGLGAVEAYKNAYREVSDQKARKKATILLKQERVMKEIEKSVLDVAKEMGVDHEYVLSKLKHLADYSDDDNIILQSTKELGKIVGTSGNIIKQREMGLLGVFEGFSSGELEGAERKELSAAKEE